MIVNIVDNRPRKTGLVMQIRGAILYAFCDRTERNVTRGSHTGLVEASVTVRRENSKRKRQRCQWFWQRTGTEWTGAPFHPIERIQNGLRTTWIGSKRKCSGQRIELACNVPRLIQYRPDSLRKSQPAPHHRMSLNLRPHLVPNEDINIDKLSSRSSISSFEKQFLPILMFSYNTSIFFMHSKHFWIPPACLLLVCSLSSSCDVFLRSIIEREQNSYLERWMEGALQYVDSNSWICCNIFLIFSIENGFFQYIHFHLNSKI